MMKEIIAAILQDDVATARKLLKLNPELAKQIFPRAKLYRSAIFHWIYAGDTLLHLAAAGYRVEIARFLLAAGAEPNAARNMRRSTPLHYAADGFITGPAWDEKRQLETIRCLLEHGANLHSRDLNGATALHRAVRTRCAGAVRYFLKAGADATARNKPGSTPFHLAVQNTGRGGSGSAIAITAQREIIQEFLAFGLSPNLKCARGKTVKDCARSLWIQQMLNQVTSRRPGL
jgi:hypothetical protein